MIRTLLVWIIGTALLALILAGCAVIESQPSPSPTTELRELTFSELSRVRSISIQDDNRCGPEPPCPYTAHFDLQLAGDHFAGTASFTTGGGYGWWLPGAVTETITIPLEIVNSFLEILAETSLETGGRHVVPTVPDSQPLVIIRLSSEGEKWYCSFSSDSPNQNHVPWSVMIIVKDDINLSGSYVTDSDAPARALELLNPYLRRDLQQKLFEEAGSRPGKR
jgi:hypothetical protein